MCDGRHGFKGVWKERNRVTRMNNSIKSGKGISSHKIWKKNPDDGAAGRVTARSLM